VTNATSQSTLNRASNFLQEHILLA